MRPLPHYIATDVWLYRHQRWGNVPPFFTVNGRYVVIERSCCYFEREIMSVTLASTLLNDKGFNVDGVFLHLYDCFSPTRIVMDICLPSIISPSSTAIKETSNESSPDVSVFPSVSSLTPPYLDVESMMDDFYSRTTNKQDTLANCQYIGTGCNSCC